jgi:hypothetical protein
MMSKAEVNVQTWLQSFSDLYVCVRMLMALHMHKYNTKIRSGAFRMLLHPRIMFELVFLGAYSSKHATYFPYKAYQTCFSRPLYWSKRTAHICSHACITQSANLAAAIPAIPLKSSKLREFTYMFIYIYIYIYIYIHIHIYVHVYVYMHAYNVIHALFSSPPACNV